MTDDTARPKRKTFREQMIDKYMRECRHFNGGAAMRYFIDTEFSELGPHKPIELISIGIVCEDGRQFYAEVRDLPRCNDWVRENVLPHLVRMGPCLGLAEMASRIQQFIGDDKPEFWGYYADYDWVVFCQIFGAMIDLPKGWPMYCNDIKQLCRLVGDPALPKQTSTEHNALADAVWNKTAYEFLVASAERELAALREAQKEKS